MPRASRCSKCRDHKTWGPERQSPWRRCRRRRTASTMSHPCHSGECPTGIRCTPCCAWRWRMCPCCTLVAPPGHPRTSSQQDTARSLSGSRMRAHRWEDTCPCCTRRGCARSSQAGTGSQHRNRRMWWRHNWPGTSTLGTPCMTRLNRWPQTCPGHKASDQLNQRRMPCPQDMEGTGRPSSGRSHCCAAQTGTAAPQASPQDSSHRSRKRPA